MIKLIKELKRYFVYETKKTNLLEIVQVVVRQGDVVRLRP